MEPQLTSDRPIQSSSQGVIYIVTGKLNYLQECIYSASTLKKHNPAVPITLFTDRTSVHKDCFDQVVTIAEGENPFLVKVKYMLESPYDKTLFLDSDTQIRASILELFSLLDQNDLALASFPKIDRKHWPAKVVDYEQPNQYNTGVILYNSSEHTKMFFQEWLTRVSQEKTSMTAYRISDQTHFNQLIKEKKHRELNVQLVKISNKRYNVRPPMILPLLFSGEMNNVKILHCHDLHKTFLSRLVQRATTKLSRTSFWQKTQKKFRNKLA